MSQSTTAPASQVFATRDGLRLSYYSWRPQGTPKRLVMLVHGFADHTMRYQPLVQHLVQEGAVVYGYDQRGNGRSPGQRGHIGSFSELVDDLDSFIKTVTKREPGLERILFAHSTGGITALSYALDNPHAVDRMILSAPALILAFQAPAWKTFMGRALSSILPTGSQKAGFDPRLVSRDPEVVRANQEDDLVSQDISFRFYTEVYLTAAPEVLKRIEELKVPFLYIHGTEDRLVSPRVADEFARRARATHRVHTYPGSYHESYNDIDRDTVFADIDLWLNEPLNTAG